MPNGLCDLRALSLLIILLALYPQEYTQLCTADKNLALYWVGLQIHQIQNANGQVNYIAAPRAELMPEIYARKWAQLSA